MIADLAFHSFGGSAASLDNWLAMYTTADNRATSLDRHIHGAAQFTGDSKALQGQQYQ